MGDKTGGARDSDNASSQVKKVTAGAPPGRYSEIKDNVYKQYENNARSSENKLSDAIKNSMKSGQSVSYYKDQQKSMIDAIQSNPNLTNYQKVTQINNIKAAGSPMAVRSGYSLGERLAGAGSLGQKTMRENTPLTQADIARMSPQMQDRAKYIASQYERAPVLKDGNIVAMAPNMSQLAGDIYGAAGPMASGIMKASPYGMAFNFLKDMYGKVMGSEPAPETEPKPEVDYRKFLGPDRMLDAQYNFDPLNNLSGIETLSNAPQLYSNMQASGGGGNAPMVATNTGGETVPEKIPFLSGIESGQIIYPTGGSTLVSYEDLLRQLA